MPNRSDEAAAATADFFISAFGARALLEASICGHQAIRENDVERCRFWRLVLDRIECSHDCEGAVGKNS